MASPIDIAGTIRGGVRPAAAAAGLAVLLASAPVGVAFADPDGLLTNLRQVTFEGSGVGPASFSRNAHSLILEGVREAGGPGQQVYVLDLGSGDVRHVSQGFAEAWEGAIHPANVKYLFSSPRNEAGKGRGRDAARPRASDPRFAEDFELYEFDANNAIVLNLTESPGYDGEAVYAPGGGTIAFASSRRGPDAARTARDASALVNIYLMHADGLGVRRLTAAPGYDGDPAFSADGKRIVYQHAEPGSAVSEIFAIDVDGSNASQLTRLGASSGAPFFHPSGAYVVFSSDAEGDDGHALYLVDGAGKRPPLRIVDGTGYDRWPAFSPDGRKLVWTSTRTVDGVPQVYIADWIDRAARRLLDLPPPPDEVPVPPVLALTRPGFSDLDVRVHVTRMASGAPVKRAAGSMTDGSPASYVAAVFEALGLEPAVPGDTFIRPLAGAGSRSNVLARLRATVATGAPAVLVGAELPRRAGADSALAGIAGLLEIAQRLVSLAAEDGGALERDVVFAVWWRGPNGRSGAAAFADERSASISAYLNVSVIGGLDDRLVVQGIASSPAWAREIERANAPLGLPIIIEGEEIAASPPVAFYRRGVPVFDVRATRAPDARPAAVNYAGAARVARFVADVTLSVARMETAPQYAGGLLLERILAASAPTRKVEAALPASARVTPAKPPPWGAIGPDPAAPALGPEPASARVRATRRAVDSVLAAAVPAGTRSQLPAPAQVTVVANAVNGIGSAQRVTAAAAAKRAAPLDRGPVVVAAAANGSVPLDLGPVVVVAAANGSVPLDLGPVVVVAAAKASAPLDRGPVVVAAAANGSVPLDLGPVVVVAAAKASAPLDRGPVVAAAAKASVPLDRGPVVVAAAAKASAPAPSGLVLAARQIAPPARPAIAPSRTVAVPHQALALGESLTLDIDVPARRAEAADAWSCIDKKRGTVRFCVEAVRWPASIETHFDVGTTVYNGTKAVVRYDAERATSAYALFDTGAFETVSRHLTERFGEPASRTSRTIAPLARPRMVNPVLVWRAADPASDRVASLEVRHYDDARGGFPDLRYGVVLLRWEKAQPIFPLVSALDLMMLK